MLIRSIVLPVCLALGACTDNSSTATNQVKSAGQTSDSTVLGIDVSHFQGEIDWQKVAESSVSFTFIKSSQGDDITDERYQSNWAGSAQYGLLHGVYHYLDPSIDATAQANYFIAVTQGEFGDFPPIVDIEAFEQQTASEVIDTLSTFIDIIEEKYNCKPMIYTSPGFWDQLDNNDFGSYPLWLADYADQPQLPQGWEQWLFWQFSDTGTINGINGDVDQDQFNGTFSQLKKLAC